jgi:hypothetical protein
MADASVCGVFPAVMVARQRPYGLPIVSSVRVSLISMYGGFGIDLKEAIQFDVITTIKKGNRDGMPFRCMWCMYISLTLILILILPIYGQTARHSVYATLTPKLLPY